MGSIVNATSAFVEDDNGNKVNISGINLNKKSLTPAQTAIENDVNTGGNFLNNPSPSSTYGGYTDSHNLSVYHSTITMPYTISDIYYNTPFANLTLTVNGPGQNSTCEFGASNDTNASYQGSFNPMQFNFPIKSLLNGNTVAITCYCLNNQYTTYEIGIVEASVSGNTVTIADNFYSYSSQVVIPASTLQQSAVSLLNGQQNYLTSSSEGSFAGGMSLQLIS